jgi:flagellin
MKITGNFNTQTIINNHKTALNQLQTSFSRLSSGKVINTAADNISDFNKTTELDMRIRALNTMTQNLESQQDYVRYKEAAMGDMNSVAQRMRELKVASGNGTLNEADLEAINQEFNKLQQNVQDIYQNSEFNTRKVFTNKYDGLNQEFREVLSQTTLSSKDVEDYSIDDLDQLLGMITSERSRLGANSLGLEAASNVYRQEALNLTSEYSIKMDTDMAKASMDLVKASLKEEVSMSMLAHAKVTQRNVLALLK